MRELLRHRRNRFDKLLAVETKDDVEPAHALVRDARAEDDEALA